jgi:hypothetical protein
MHNLYVPPGALVVIQVDYSSAGSTGVTAIENYIKNVLGAHVALIPSPVDGVVIDVLQPDPSPQIFNAMGTQAPVPASTGSSVGSQAGTVLGSRP